MGPSMALAFITSLIFITLSSSISLTNSAGFTSTLIHRDSVKSPFYNPKLTYSARLQESVKRSFDRYHYIQSKTSKQISRKDIEVWTWPDYGEFHIIYDIGTPAMETIGLIDTGSTLIWLQCLPCELCFNQSIQIPIFDPTKSSTYSRVPCNESNRCAVGAHMCGKDGYCKYITEYMDNTYSKGELAVESLAFRDEDSAIGYDTVNMVIGCGHNNSKNKDNAPGIIGLGKTFPSLVSQLPQKKFSYCLVSNEAETEATRIRFGSAARIHGSTTPILNSYFTDEFYYLTLEGISVNVSRLPINPAIFELTDEGGGVLLDSGATYTYLQLRAYKMLTDELGKTVNWIEDPFRSFGFCFDDRYDLKEIPAITFHFSGVDLKLDPESTWKYVGFGTYCLAMFPTTEDVAATIFGNYQQQNLNIGHDLENMILSFERKNCVTDDRID